MENKNIIIILLVVIIILLAAIVAVSFNVGKHDVQLTFKSKTKLNQGDSLKIKLTDANGTSLSNKQINITITDKNGTTDYHSVVTNDKGVCKLKLDKSPGKYSVICKFSGDAPYSEKTINKTITIKKDVKQAQIDSSSSYTNSDPGAFYSAQANRVIYTGEIHDGPDGHRWKHLGNNEWVKID